MDSRVARLTRRFTCAAALAVAVVVVAIGASWVQVAAYGYDGVRTATSFDLGEGTHDNLDQRTRAARFSPDQAKHRYDGRSNLASASARLDGYRLAPQTASNVPTVVFSRSRAPGIAQNFDDAVAHGAPTRLTRVDAAARDANRRAALRGQSPAPAGQSLDEYPFACSAQGGCGSFVRSVPVGEQSYQGGVLSRFFQDYGIRPGDPFDVMFGL